MHSIRVWACSRKRRIALGGTMRRWSLYSGAALAMSAVAAAVVGACGGTNNQFGATGSSGPGAAQNGTDSGGGPTGPSAPTPVLDTDAGRPAGPTEACQPRGRRHRVPRRPPVQRILLRRRRAHHDHGQGLRPRQEQPALQRRRLRSGDATRRAPEGSTDGHRRLFLRRALPEWRAHQHDDRGRRVVHSHQRPGWERRSTSSFRLASGAGRSRCP